MSQQILQKYTIGDLIDVPPVQTVIRLEQSTRDAANIVSSFVFTADVDTHFRVLSESFLHNHGQGYFLQGDFGSGKSHFLAALAAWFSKLPGSDILTSRHDGLQKLRGSARNLLAVSISLVNYRSNTSLENIITDAIEEKLRTSNISAAISAQSQFLQYLKNSLKDLELRTEFCSRFGILEQSIEQWIDEHRQEAHTDGLLFIKSKGLNDTELYSIERYLTFDTAMRAATESGFDGIVLLIDELSEFFRSKPDSTSLNEDARTLQLLGELSKSRPLWIIAAVQESIERTGDVAQATFRKIKDRFPVKLHLSTLHIRDLISGRLVRMKPDADAIISRIYQEFCKHFPGFSATPAVFRSIYPVHPLTLSLLEGLGDLFSQHRGIVDFVHSQIAGDSGRNIAGILKRDCTSLISPDAIYDHFATRIAEFSSFYIYPSHIIPHLDNTIEECIDDEQDRILARRLIRILVLYAIHPTASPPTVGVLAELVSCMLSFQDPDANSQYVGEVLLDPIAEKSRFLVKKSSSSGAVQDTVYLISTNEDQVKILRSRIDRVLTDIAPGDSRIFLNPLSELPESYSWPGPSLWIRPVERTTIWRQSTRKVAVFYLYPGNEFSIEQQIDQLLDNGRIDMALVLSSQQIKINCKNTALWTIPSDTADNSLLKEYFACKMIAGELRTSNPSDMPLIPRLKELIKKLEPAVYQHLLQQIYGGNFSDPTITLEPAAREIRRFDRIIETAAELILETRYPRFKEISSRSISPTLRYYQHLFDDFITQGTISLKDARTRGLSEIIETMAVPLGLVEVKSGDYILSPNPVSNQFLSWFFGLLPVSGKIQISDLLLKMQTGVYGTPRDLACFLISSLAFCGHISLINHGRTVPLDYIKITNIEQIESIAPGELVNQADRETILNSFSFLYGSQTGDSFGLRQQGDIWQSILKFKTSGATLINELDRKIKTLSGFSAFNNFNFDDCNRKCISLSKVLDEIKISYSAREGLERFLSSWRISELTSDDITHLKKLEKFLGHHAERIVFINHYLHHNSVMRACDSDRDTSQSREAVVLILQQPHVMVIPDDGEQLQAAFEIFSQSYIRKYTIDHTIFQKSRKKTAVSKHSSKALQTIQRLAAIATLDRPRSTQQLLEELDKPAPVVCTRNTSEELLRSPMCSCGYQCGTVPDQKATYDPESSIERIMHDYTEILCNPQVLEAVSARAFALRDVDKYTAERLQNLYVFLKNNSSAPSLALCDLLDDSVISELNKALSGSTSLENRNLDVLKNELAWRRLTPSRIREIFNQWLGNPSGDTIISIDQNTDSSGYNSLESLLWPCLHQKIFHNSTGEPLILNSQVQSSSTMLEQQFPSKKLSMIFDRTSTSDIIDFICREPLHLAAIQAAWSIVCDRILNTATQITEPIFSNFMDNNEGMRIKSRLISLKKFSENFTCDFPSKLCTRLAAAFLHNDLWATPQLKRTIQAIMNKITAESSDWFETLPSIKKVNPTDCSTIILIDGISADVWLELTSMNPSLFTGAFTGFHRISVPGLTIDSINELFGIPANKDPATELANQQISYITISGDEDHLWKDLTPASLPGKPQLIRISAIDKQLHAGTLHLYEVPVLLNNLLTRNIPSLLGLCKSEKRTLILTSDHGFSFSSKGLSHGIAGGPYERSVFRVEWQPGQMYTMAVT
ncbi:MAG TPA: DUF6079 family protein [Chitinispirillaceae bacterium]|nr:DUF6079 family protein [Chitinispirillaceae bacterium]